MSSKIISATPKEILRIYRTILRLVIVYPSVKRHSLLREIHDEFRTNKKETDPIVLSDAIKRAIFGITHLRKYSNIDQESSDWVIDLEKEPMPPPERQWAGALVRSKAAGQMKTK
jgi:hypothetical protein